MKKDSFIFPFKSNFFKEQDPFHLVVIFFIIFFGTAIFFSIPTFYNYTKYNQQIENTINSQFKIKMQNLEDISFRFIPSPHLLIKEANLKIKDNEKNLISKLKKVKVFISLTNLYKNDEFKIKKIEINNANFYLNSLSLKNFINNMKKNIINHLIIKKSKLFFKDKNDEIILISTIKNLDYKIDFVNNKKTLKIQGNIFDTNYDYKYLIDYNNPNIQDVNLEFKNPNVQIQNRLVEDFNSSKINKSGKLTFSFINRKNIINYNIEDNTISFYQNNNKNFNLNIEGTLNIKPFHFDLNVDIEKIKLDEIENIFYFIYLNQKLKYENLSGNLKLNLINIDYKALNKGIIELIFEDVYLYSNQKKFYLNDFAVLEISDYEYLEDIDQILQMKIKINILDQDKFNRFLFNFKKDKILSENIYFTYQYNNNTKSSFISQISDKGFKNYNQLFKFNNFQQLKNILRNEKIFNLE